jgi:hypothetical protein
LPVEILPGKHILLEGSREKIKIPIDNMGQMMVNYAGNFMSFGNSRFSFCDVYEAIKSGRPIVPPSTFRDKIVIVGISNPVNSDIHPTPVDNLLPGVAIHAMAIDTILQNLFLYKASWLYHTLVLLLIIAAAVFAASYMRSLVYLICVGGLIIVSGLISYLSFSLGGIIISPLQPSVGVLLSIGGTKLYGYIKVRYANTRPSPHKVFISYSRPDQKVANKICVALESRGIGCWIDMADISLGEKWRAEITKAIENSRAMILVFSSHSNRAPQVEEEIKQAILNGVRIIPYRIENVQPSEFMQNLFQETQYLDALKRPRGKNIQRLVRDVERFLSEDEPKKS